MKKNTLYVLLISTLIHSACNNANQKQTEETKNNRSSKKGTFAYDLKFLQGHDSVIVLKSNAEKSLVIVSPKYQGKVFTSSAEGNEGSSFGWVNYKAFIGPANAHMNAYGGEDRFWLGPEGGKFSLFFKPDSQMVFDNWKTPAPIDTESWTVTKKSNQSVALQKNMRLTNYKGTQLQLLVDRTITILEPQQVNDKTGIALDGGIKAVGYETVNVLTNKGATEWTEATGMPCMWLLDMFKPTSASVIVVPFKNAAGKSFDKVATTNYFGQIPPDRLKHTNEALFFKADGKSRGKLGVMPNMAKTTAGCYDGQNKVLTVIMFDVDANGKYLNQEWNTTRPSFLGDAVNAYNDGPLADGTQMGPFLEIESVSPAAFLKPNASLTHKHSVFHFTGDEKALDGISKKLLGVSIDDIKKAF